MPGNLNDRAVERQERSSLSADHTPNKPFNSEFEKKMAEDGWKPISTAPKNNQRIEVFSRTAGYCEAWWISALEEWGENLGSGYMVPRQNWTHWREICD